MSVVVTRINKIIVSKPNPAVGEVVVEMWWEDEEHDVEQYGVMETPHGHAEDQIGDIISTHTLDLGG